MTSARAAARQRSRRLLLLALLITTSVLAAEAVGGIITGSLALLADAGHMASDAGALGLSLTALWLASRPASEARTYGFQRAEILAALANSVALVFIASYVSWEAVQRLGEPPDVDAGPMLGVAVVGLAANLASASLLARERSANLNVRSAFLHVVGDALSSAGVIVAAIIILTAGEYAADPIISLFIAALILLSAGRIAWDSTQILMEATPPGISVPAIQEGLLAVPGVRGVHDLHVWTVTSGFVSLSAHIEANGERDPHDILVDLRSLLFRKFGIEHATLQIETLALHQELESCCGIDTQEVSPDHALHHP